MSFVDPHAPPSDDTLYELTALSCDFSWVYDPATGQFVHLGGQLGRQRPASGGDPGSILPEPLASRLSAAERERISLALEEGRFEGVVPLEEPEGGPRWLELRIREHGALHYGMARDVTRQHLLERAEKLEGAGAVAGAVAHDFNTLLTAILLHAEVAKEELPRGSFAAEALSSIGLAGRRATELTRRLMACAGSGLLSRQPLDLNALIGELRGSIERVLGRAARLELSLSPSLPKVNGDRSRLGELVMSLVSNASRALEGGPGRVTLSTGLARLGRRELDRALLGPARAEGDHLVLSVSDTGVGMSPETLSHLFEPFFSTWPPGRGLGLATALGVLKVHRGAVEVRSRPGAGTTFSIYLPANG